MDFCLIFVPFGHYDEPEILPYENPSICPKGADVRHSEAVSTLKRGGADLIPNSGILPQRLDTYAFTAPVETFLISVFVRDDTHDLNGEADLVGRKLAVVETNIGLFLFGKRKDIDVQVYRDARTALFQLITGRVDALVYPQSVLLALARGTEDAAEFDHRIFAGFNGSRTGPAEFYPVQGICKEHQ
jgi:ABC-type amino acid transport substrate-binding protein